MLLGSAAQPVLDNYAVLSLVYHHSLSTVKMNIKISGKSLRERPIVLHSLMSSLKSILGRSDDHVKTSIL